LIDFQGSFTDRLKTKFSTKQALYSPTYLTDVAALPCETAMFKNRINLKYIIERRCFEVFFADVPA